MPSLFQALIDNIPSPVYYKDARGVYTIYNKAFREYFEISDHQFIGKDIFALPIRREDAEAHHKVDQELLREPGSKMYELRCEKLDGSVRHELVKKATITAPDGTIAGIVGLIMDISEQKKMEAEVLRSRNLQSLSTLAGGIAHDFNNLLMAIVGNLSLAKLNTSKNAGSMEYLDEAERITFLGKNLTQQLLTFSRGGKLVRKIIQLESVVASASTDILHGSPIQCLFDIPHGVFPVEGDEEQLRQVFENILRNAKEAMPAGGKITIGMRNLRFAPDDRLPLIEEDHVRVSISDEGMGISPENISRAFDPYYTTKGMGAEKGVGLGLAISYAIIKRHGGNISLESTRGLGSIIHVDLPAYKICAEKAPEDNRSMTKTGRILLLDDEELILAIAEELLIYLGYTAITVRSGEEAVAIYNQAIKLNEPFDAVILDLAVPGGMGGKEVVRELLRLDPNVKAIISSGYLTDPIIENYKEYGFAEVLTKPYDADELERKLRKIITG